LNTSR